MMLDHAKILRVSTRVPGTTIPQGGNHSSEQGSQIAADVSSPFHVLPENMENIHHPVTATAVWNFGRAQPSKSFAIGQSKPVLRGARFKPPDSLDFSRLVLAVYPSGRDFRNQPSQILEASHDHDSQVF